ncbi:hypothetical protein Trydic_g8042 [Trypoxylus dichotomus]
MFPRKVAVRLLIPAATLVAEKTELKCRPSELPIYTTDPPKEPTKIVTEPGVLEKQIGNIRKEIMALTKHVENLENTIADSYTDGIKQVQWLVNYLQEEDNTTPRAGAIAIGGLAGLILGLRGRFFRRLLFTTTGALGMAAICYPHEAVEYSDIARKEAKRYFSIAYNFYYGEKEPEITGEVIADVLSESDDLDLNMADPEALVSHVHDNASGENCHCPIGTCLSPQDEVPPTHPTS